jgi:hypothetical protein
VIVTGGFCLVGSVWFVRERPKIAKIMRPIYRELGLLPARNAELIPDVQEPAASGF